MPFKVKVTGRQIHINFTDTLFRLKATQVVWNGAILDIPETNLRAYTFTPAPKAVLAKMLEFQV